MTPEQRKELVRLLQNGEELSPEWSRILFPLKKREYELVYHGKEREEDILADTLAVPLQPVRTFGDNGGGWHNMLIFGDNLQALKTLLEMKKAGKLRNADGTAGVRLVYIDPPFSTRRDFLGTEDQKAYQDKLAGGEFLEFLRKRLVLIRELLSDDGTCFVHLDLKKIHHVKLLLDEIFGESRILNEIVWHYENKLGTGGDLLDRRHDTLLWYGAGKKHKFNAMQEPVKEQKLQPALLRNSRSRRTGPRSSSASVHALRSWHSKLRHPVQHSALDRGFDFLVLDRAGREAYPEYRLVP